MYSRNNTELTKLSSLNEMYHRMLLVPYCTSDTSIVHNNSASTVPVPEAVQLLIESYYHRSFFSCLLRQVINKYH